MKTLSYQFVNVIPREIVENILYISLEYRTAIHKCCCGCRNEVVTPLSPTDWQLIFNGESVSLFPSIGNWGFNCKSHYWIRNNEVHWAKKWTKKEIKAGRKKDSSNKKKFFSQKT